MVSRLAPSLSVRHRGIPNRSLPEVMANSIGEFPAFFLIYTVKLGSSRITVI